MKNCFAPSAKSLFLWGTLLLIAFGGPAATAAEDNGVRHFYRNPFLFIAVAAFLLALIFAAWRFARRWRARVLRQRDEEIFNLINIWTKSLQEEVARRKEAQQALQNSHELTLRQERLAAVGQLAAGLAHEFNNILTIIQGHAVLLMEEPGLSNDSRKSVTHICEGVERITTLVKQMLAFSRKQVMQQRVVNIKESMNEFADMLRRLLGAHIALTFDIRPDLASVTVDPEMLQQIIANLAVNARDVMLDGGQLHISADEIKFDQADLAGISDRRAGSFIRLSVADTGPGIAPSVLTRLFEPFFTTKEIGKGTGLGLATAYGMIKQNAGWIEVDSMLGEGTTFRIYFPVAANQPAPKPAPAPAPAASETILVVDDEEVLRNLVREILESLHYRVLAAASGQEALQLWETHKDSVNLVLTDMSMPDGMSGNDLALKLLADRPGLPIIFSSGFLPEQDNPQRLFLAKPYEPDDLARAVRSALAQAAGARISAPAPNSTCPQ
jgi:signal transduction histidine kinase/ActR/RegA family two-component response regulator